MKRTRKSNSKKPLLSLIRRLWKFAIVNYFITIFLPVFFLSASFLCTNFLCKDIYAYTRVKVSQGLWWANTAKPSIWMLKAFKKVTLKKV